MKERKWVGTSSHIGILSIKVRAVMWIQIFSHEPLREV